MKRFSNYKNEFTQDLKKIINYKTYLNEINEFPTRDQLMCLTEFLSICKKHGFTKFYCEKNGKYGYAEVGEGKELIGILGHLDVVGPGNIESWKSNPFILEERDGKLFGRGTADDKGPMLLQVYVIKSLLESKIPLNKRIRVILGTDEEMLWRGINEYLKNEEIPTQGYTPDSVFPVTKAEMGLLQIKLIEKINTNDIIHLNGGESINAVAETFTYKGNKLNEVINETKQLNLNYKTKDDYITFIGKTSHAMCPENGTNAIILGSKILNKFINYKTINFINNELDDKNSFGEKLFNQKITDDITGNLRVNLGKIEIKNSEIITYFDFRIPIRINVKSIKNEIKNKAKKYNLNYEEISYLKPLYINERIPFIKRMIEIYNFFEKTNDKAIVSSGATYARSMPNIVAFGPMFKNDERTEHKPNEYISIQTLEKSFNIYQRTLIEFNKR